MNNPSQPNYIGAYDRLKSSVSADPERGSCTSILEQDDDCTWISQHKPPFVKEEFVEWVGDRIENHSK